MQRTGVVLVLFALVACIMAAEFNLSITNQAAKKRESNCPEYCSKIYGTWFFQASVVSGSEGTSEDQGDQYGDAVGEINFDEDCNMYIQGYAQKLYSVKADLQQQASDWVYWNNAGYRFTVGSPAFLSCYYVDNDVIWCVGSSLFGTYGARDVYTYELTKST